MTDACSHRAWEKLTALTIVACLAACTGGGGGGGGSSAPSEPPADLNYGVGIAWFLSDVPAPAYMPTWEGSIDSFTVDPELPGGLAIDPETGVISGTPIEASDPATYVVSGFGPLGFETTSIELAVVDPPRLAFVASTTDDTIGRYTIDRTSGDLAFNGYQEMPFGESGPEQVVAHPSGRFLFVPNQDDKLSIFEVMVDTGRLTPQLPVSLGAGPHHCILTYEGARLYVSNEGSDEVHAFQVNSDTGALTLLGLYPTAPGPSRLSLDPDGRFLYVTQTTDGSVRTFAIETGGTLTAAAQDTSFAGLAPVDVVFSPDTGTAFVTLAGAGAVQPVRVDEVTGVLTVEGDPLLDTADLPSATALHPTSQHLYVTHPGQDQITHYELSPEGPRFVAAYPTLGEPVEISFDRAGVRAYVVHRGSHEITVYDVALRSGALVSPMGTRTRSEPVSLAVTHGTSPLYEAPSFLYVAGGESDDVVTYAVDAGTGDITELGVPTPTGDDPRDLALDPHGRFAFVASVGDRSITSYSIEANGTLTQLGAPFVVATQPRGLAVDPSGRWLFIGLRTTDRIMAFSIDGTTGALTFVDEAPAGTDTRRVAVDPTGRFVYAMNFASDDVTCYRFQGGAFLGTPVVTTAPGRPDHARFSPRGDRLYLAGNDSDHLIPYAIDRETGGLTPIPPGRGVGNRPLVVEIHPSNRFAYAAISDLPTGTGHVSFHTLDPETGNMGLPVEFQAGLNPTNLRVSPGGQFLFVLNQEGDDISIFDIDESTGELSKHRSRATALEPRAIEFSRTFY